MSCCPIVAPKTPIEEGIPDPAEGPKERLTGTDDPTLVEKAATFFFLEFYPSFATILGASTSLQASLALTEVL